MIIPITLPSVSKSTAWPSGVASVSAPVRGPGGRILAAVSVSGPIERLTRSPGRMHAPAVVAAGDRISKLLRAET